MYIKIIRVILIIVSLIYIGLILIFLIRDIEYLLRYGYGVGGKKSVFGLPITADQDKFLALHNIIANHLRDRGTVENPIRFTSAELLQDRKSVV